MGKVLKPDLAQAERFLNLLEPGGEFWFQTQIEPKPDGRGAPRVLSGTLEQCWAQLVGINANGHAVWVQINAGNGRADKDVTRLRAYFVDIDEGDGTSLLNSEVPADIINETSPGKFHGYWLTPDGPVDKFKARQLALAEKFGGETSVCNPGRVMRLPGLVHWKETPFLSRILRIRPGL